MVSVLHLKQISQLDGINATSGLGTERRGLGWKVLVLNLGTLHVDV